MNAGRLTAVGVALLVLALVAAAALLRRPPERAPAPAGECADPAACGVEPETPEPLAVPPSPAPTPVEKTTVAPPSPVAPPTEAAARREDADRLLAEGKVMEAIEVFRKVVAAEPTARNHGDFGSLLYRVTAFDEATVHLRAAAELDPGNADRWIALANVYYRKVNPGEAWKAEKRAREAEPGLELGRDAEGMRVRRK